MVTLLLLMPLFQYTPNVILGAIIVTAVIGLIDVPAACQIWKIDKFDFLVMLCAFLGVLFISVEEGLAIAVGISIFKVLLQITRPKTLVLGNIPGTNIYRDLHHYKEAVSIPGFLILSIEAPINFANTTYLKERYEKNIKFYHLISFLSQPCLLSVRITRWMEEYETDSENSKNKSQLKFVILDLSGEFTTKTPIILWSFWTNKSHFCEMAFITCSCECNRYKWCLIFQRFENGSGEEKHGGKSIYMSKARVFWNMHDLELMDVCSTCSQLVLVNPLGEVIEKLQRSDDANELARPDCLFLTVGEAVASLVLTNKTHSSSCVWWAWSWSWWERGLILIHHFSSFSAIKLYLLM